MVGPSASCDAHSLLGWQDVEVEQDPAERYGESDGRGGGDAAVNDKGRPGWSDALYQYHQSSRLCGGPSLLCNPPSPWPTAMFALGTARCRAKLDSGRWALGSWVAGGTTSSQPGLARTMIGRCCPSQTDQSP